MDTQCALCTGAILPKMDVTILGCEHRFHARCIHLYFTEFNSACPRCALEMPADKAYRPNFGDILTSRPPPPAVTDVPAAEEEEEEEAAPRDATPPSLWNSLFKGFLTIETAPTNPSLPKRLVTRSEEVAAAIEAGMHVAHLRQQKITMREILALKQYDLTELLVERPYTLHDLHSLGATWDNLCVMGLSSSETLNEFLHHRKLFSIRDLHKLYRITYLTILKGCCGDSMHTFCRISWVLEEFALLQVNMPLLIAMGMTRRDLYNLSHTIAFSDIIKLGLQAAHLAPLKVDAKYADRCGWDISSLHPADDIIIRLASQPQTPHHNYLSPEQVLNELGHT